MAWKFNPWYLLPGGNLSGVINNITRDGYQLGDLSAGVLGFNTYKEGKNKKAPSGDNSALKSFEDFYRENYDNQNPYSLGSKIGNFFSGEVSSAKDAYQNYLSNYEFARNQDAAAQANAATWQREDSAVQRAMGDYQSAGLNPYLLLNGSGGISAASSPATKADYKRARAQEQESRAVSSAVKVLMLILLKKML